MVDLDNAYVSVPLLPPELMDEILSWAIEDNPQKRRLLIIFSSVTRANRIRAQRILFRTLRIYLDPSHIAGQHDFSPLFGTLLRLTELRSIFESDPSWLTFVDSVQIESPTRPMAVTLSQGHPDFAAYIAYIRQAARAPRKEISVTKEDINCLARSLRRLTRPTGLILSKIDLRTNHLNALFDSWSILDRITLSECLYSQCLLTRVLGVVGNLHMFQCVDSAYASCVNHQQELPLSRGIQHFHHFGSTHTHPSSTASSHDAWTTYIRGCTEIAAACLVAEVASEAGNIDATWVLVSTRRRNVALFIHG